MAGDKKMKAVDQFDGTSTTSQIAFFFFKCKKKEGHTPGPERLLICFAL